MSQEPGRVNMSKADAVREYYRRSDAGDFPAELFTPDFQFYFPKVAQGMVLTLGRFISPADIEAQLAPQNLLFTHSVFFDFDAPRFSIIEFVALQDRISGLLCAPADVMSRGGIHPRLRPSIEGSAVQVF